MCSRYWLNGNPQHTRMEVVQRKQRHRGSVVGFCFFKGCHDLAEGAVLSNRHPGRSR